MKWDKLFLLFLLTSSVLVSSHCLCEGPPDDVAPPQQDAKFVI